MDNTNKVFMCLMLKRNKIEYKKATKIQTKALSILITYIYESLKKSYKKLSESLVK